MPFSAQTILAFVALIFLGAIALLMIFFTVPSSNEKLIIFCLGALAGAITTTGVTQALHKPDDPKE